MTDDKWKMKMEMKSITGSLQAWDFLLRAGAKACPHVPTVRRVEVTIRVSNQGRTRSPTTAAQNLVIAKPRLGILLVRPRDKPRIWAKRCARPLPGVADHLAASESAVARRQSVGLDATHCSPVQISAIGGWPIIAPWVSPLVIRDRAAIK